MSPGVDFWEFVRSQVIGSQATIETPFGTRRMTYADDTASGRGVEFIERHLRNVLEHYGNTHTEDDATGVFTSALPSSAGLHAMYLTEAVAIAERLRKEHGPIGCKTTERDLIPFVYVQPRAIDPLKSE
ncbi:MAG: hypothetical protein V3S41_07005 [Spirochaetia bacterium]